jgi:hypothetical protein
MSGTENGSPRPKKKHVFGKAAAAGAALLIVFAGMVWLTLPDVADLKTENPKSTALIERRKADARAQGKTLVVRIHWIAFDRIPPLLKKKRPRQRGRVVLRPSGR